MTIILKGLRVVDWAKGKYRRGCREVKFSPIFETTFTPCFPMREVILDGYNVKLYVAKSFGEDICSSLMNKKHYLPVRLTNGGIFKGELTLKKQGDVLVVTTALRVKEDSIDILPRRICPEDIENYMEKERPMKGAIFDAIEEITL